MKRVFCIFFRMKFSRIASRIFHVFVLMKAVTLLGDVPMPHSGHIAVEGTPYWGNGYFKFAIIDENEKALWTHDNSQKIPPTDHMSLEVKNGFYSVYLGDESVTGMKALPASSLLSSERIFLRVWFSKSGEDFETVGVDLALGAAPFALVSETTRGGGLSMEQSVSDLEARLDALEAAMSNITAASSTPCFLPRWAIKSSLPVK